MKKERIKYGQVYEGLYPPFIGLCLKNSRNSPKGVSRELT